MNTRLVHPTTAIIVSVFCLVACGPKPDPVEPDEGDTGDSADTGDDGEDAAAAAAAEEAAQEEQLAEYNTLINALNAAIEHQDTEAFDEVFTMESQQLFVRIALMDMAISGITDLTPKEHVLHQQKDFNVVYTITDVDYDTGAAMLVGVIRDSGEEVRFPLVFVEEDGTLKIDYSDVLEERLANLTESRMQLIVADLTKAMAAGDAELYSTLVTEDTATTCPDFLGILPPPKGKKAPKLSAVMKKLKKKKAVVTVGEVDTVGHKATLVVKIGDETKDPVIVNFIIEAGDMRIEASARCEAPAE